jgi:hypothetical protein
MASTIRITINEDVERVLERLKGDYPTLDYPELFKLGLSELYHKRERAARAAWIESLPIIEPSKKEREELSQALKEADEFTRAGKAKGMTVDEILAEALSR